MKYLSFTLVLFLLTIKTMGCALPVAGAIHGYSGTLCTGNVITLTNDSSGGSWFCLNTALATIDASSGIVTPVSPGHDTILYVLTNSCGADTVKLQVSINVTPVPIYFSSLSVGSYCLFTIPAGATMSAVTGAATWHSGTDTLYGVSAGVAAFTVSDSGCTSYDTVTVGTFPVVGPITLSATVHGCAGNMGTASDTTSGGTWSSNNPSVASISSSTGSLQEIATGIAMITYSVTGSSGTAWRSIELFVDQVPTNITGLTHVCRGLTDTLSTTRYSSLFSSTVLGVNWASSNASIATVATGDTSHSVVLTGVQEGTIILTATSISSGCSTSVNITVDTLPALASITGTTTLCSSTTTTLTETVPGGVWSSSNSTVGTVSTSGVVTGLFSGTDSIIYKVTNSCGYVEKYDIITVNPLPALDLITGTTTINVGTTTTLSDMTTGGTWSSGAPGIATVDATTGIVTGVSIGTVIITYTVSNSFDCTNFTTIAVDVVVPAGIENIENNGTSHFTLYPNPVKGILNISWADVAIGNADISIKDVTGRTIYKNNFYVNAAVGRGSVDLSNLNSGIYFIAVHSGNTHFIGKVVVE